MLGSDTTCWLREHSDGQANSRISGVRFPAEARIYSLLNIDSRSHCNAVWSGQGVKLIAHFSFFCPVPPHVLVDFVVLPPGHGSSVTDFWGWDAHEAQFEWWHRKDGVPGGPLNLNSTNLPRPWSQRESSPSGKIPTVEPRIEPGTAWLVVRNSDHLTTRLVAHFSVVLKIRYRNCYCTPTNMSRQTGA